MPGRHWFPLEDDMLRAALRRGHDDARIALLLGRSPLAVKRRRRRIAPALSLREARRRLGVSWRRLYGWIDAGRLRTVRRGRWPGVTEADLAAVSRNAERMAA